MTDKHNPKKLNLSTTLPQFPQVMLELIRACDDEKTGIDELTDIISTDPALISKLMEIIGSAYLSLPKSVDNLKTAVVYLGLDTIRNLAISSCAIRFFTKVKAMPGFDINRFWFHAYTCGLIARQAARETGQANPEEYFIAGLLHDIGRLVLMENFPDQYQTFYKEFNDEKEILTAEQKQFGIHTPKVSATLFKRWDLNPLIADAVLFVNEKRAQIETSLSHVKIIYASNILAGEEINDKEQLRQKAGDLAALIGIHDLRLDQIVQACRQETLEMAKSLGIEVERQAAEQTQKDIQKKHEKEISEKIKDLSLFYGTLHNLLHARDFDAVLDIVQNGLKIVFNISRVFYFFLDQEKSILTGMCSKADKAGRILKSIALPVSNRSSIIVDCLKSQKNTTSLDNSSEEDMAVSDQQIMHLMETPQMFCLPVTTGRSLLGVMVLGCDKEQASKLKENSGLLKLFSGQTAVCLQNIIFFQEYARKVHEKKMEAYTMLTARVIHEVNNPIAIVKNYIQTLELKLPDKHPAQEELSVINEEMSRIASLLIHLKNFSQPAVESFDYIDLNLVCRNMLDILQKSILLPNQIEADIRLDENMPRVKTDQNAVKQIIINLVKNAAEALKKGGKISLETRLLKDSAKIMIDEKRKIPGMAEIIVSDNGPGIDEAVREKIFEPYVSTKDRDTNSGLGLSIVYALVKELNGDIICVSEKKTGTQFIITLPVSSSKKDRRTNAAGA